MFFNALFKHDLNLIQKRPCVKLMFDLYLNTSATTTTGTSEMNVEKLLLEIKKHENIVSESSEFIRETQQNIAEFLCPFKVGERVLDHDGVAVNIERIFFESYGKLNYDFSVRRLKVNGELRRYPTRAWYIEKYTKIPS